MSYWVGGAMVAGSLINGVGAKKGADQEAQGYDKARGEMRQLEGDATKALGYTDPFQQYRNTYASQLNDILQGKRSIQEDPGYQYSYDETMRATNREAAKGGYGNSGNRQLALQKNAAGLASQQYSSIMDRLINLSGAGSQNAAAGGQQYGNMMTESRMGVGNSYIGQYSAKGAGTSGLFSGVGNAVGSLGSIFGGQSGGGLGGGIDKIFDGGLF